MRNVFLWVVLATSIVRAAEEPLPKWAADERKAYEHAGGVKQSLPFVLFDPSVPSNVLPLEIDPPKAEDITADPVRKSEVRSKYLEAYFSERPKEYLVDPQGLLGAKDFNDRLNFLNYHAGDSSIDFYVYLFDGHQEIPGEARAEEMMERLFNTGRPAAVVFYFVGAPQRSEIFLSPSLTDGVPAAEERRALQSSVMTALEKSSSAAQLEAFSIQMSIRIYWMERMIGGATPEELAAMIPFKKQAVAKPPGAFERYKVMALAWYETWRVRAAIGGGLVIFLSAFVFWMRSRARWYFPELEVEPRLGGAHCAGVGAVISFASASLPPASQKDQVPDYLRRA